MDEKDTTTQMDEIPMEPESEEGENTLMAILAYIGPLVIVSYIVAKDDPFVKFHIKQGLVLFVLEVIMWFIMMTFWLLFPVLQIVNIAIFVLAIIGIVNAVGGKKKVLPLVGGYADKFNF